MSDLRAVVLSSLGGAPVVAPKKKRPVVVLRKKKKKKKKKNVVVKRKAVVVPVDDVDEREVFKRSRTVHDIELEGRAHQADKLKAQEVILREKSEALLAENESKDLIIAQLKAQLVEKNETIAKLSALEENTALVEAQESAREWEAQARLLVDEGNAAIEEMDSRCTAVQAKFDELHTRYKALHEKHREVRQDAEDLGDELDDKDELVEEQQRKILSLSAQRTDVELTELAAIKMIEEKESLLVATMAALEEVQRRLDAAKNREKKAERETSSLKAKLLEAQTRIKELRTVESEWVRRWGSLNQGKIDGSTKSNMPVDESAELSRIKSANISLEFQLSEVNSDLAQAKKDLIGLQNSMSLRVGERDKQKEEKDKALATIKKLTNAIKKKDVRLNAGKEMAEGFQARMTAVEERYKERHARAIANMEETKESEVAKAGEDYNRAQLEIIDLTERYEEVCKDYDDLRKNGDPGKISSLEIDLTKYKESYAKVVASNKKWEGVHEIALSKIVEWKAAEVSWVAERTRMQSSLSEATQRLMVLEHRATPTREDPTEQVAPSDYISTIESMAGAFVVSLEQALTILDEDDSFTPMPMFAEAIRSFPQFKEALEQLMLDRVNSRPHNAELYHTVNLFLTQDFAAETQPFPLEKMTSIFHVAMTMMESYIKRANQHNVVYDKILEQLKETSATIDHAINNPEML
jgi:chromosome segregation ATPase